MSNIVPVRKVVYVENAELVTLASSIPAVRHRASRVSSLVRSSGLASKMELVSPETATFKELMSFHSSDYLNTLINVDCKTVSEADLQMLEQEFGLGYDCPLDLEPNLFRLCQLISGASLLGAQALLKDAAVAINWHGGWHHGQRDRASGFCYVNDVVLAINKLRSRFNKILYVDLDVHHGDGVENAFSHSNQVFTFSLHMHEPGFFPGTGSIDDIGTTSSGLYYTLNIPLKEGIRDESYTHLFNELFPLLMSTFEPDALVLQCGADCLAKDPLGGFNLTPASIIECLKTILGYRKPLLLLGGGGYDACTAAKFWTLITSFVLHDQELLINGDIPEQDQFYDQYAPSFEFTFENGLRKDRNSDEYVKLILNKAKSNLQKLDKIQKNYQLDF